MKSDFAFKIVILGNPAVGKTSLIIRYIKNKFKEGDYQPTIGVDFLTKEVDLYGAHVRMLIWDMGGQDKWASRRAKFLKGSDGAVIVYSNIDIESYLTLDKWVKEINTHVGKPIPIIIVRNKTDLPPIKDDLYPAYLGDLAKNLIETSAKSGDNVENMFLRIGGDIIKQKADDITKLKKR